MHAQQERPMNMFRLGTKANRHRHPVDIGSTSSRSPIDPVEVAKFSANVQDGTKPALILSVSPGTSDSPESPQEFALSPPQAIEMGFVLQRLGEAALAPPDGGRHVKVRRPL